MVVLQETESNETAEYQIEAEHVVGVSICCAAWSEKLDVIALATIAGDVCLHRLSWQKWWQINVCEEGDGIISLTWSPNGNTLAVGSRKGMLYLYDTETAELVHKHKPSGENDSIVYLHWSTLPLASFLEENKNFSCKESAIFDSNTRHERLLPPLQPFDQEKQNLTGSFSKCEDCFSTNSILVVGHADGLIKCFIGGVLAVITIDMKKYTENEDICLQECKLQSVDDFSSLFVTILNTKRNSEERYVIDLSLLNEFEVQLSTIAEQAIHVNYLIRYIYFSIENMESAWEDIIANFGRQLDQYENQTSAENSVEHEFIQLFLLGTCEPDFENFLVNVLSEQLIKKTATTLELSCGRMLNLGINHLKRGLEALLFHTSEIVGLTRFPGVFEEIGVTEEIWSSCLDKVREFVCKNEELMKLLQESRSNFRCFFSWLYQAIWKKKGNEEEIRPLFDELDFVDIAKVLGDYLVIRTKTNTHFASSVVKQYFQNENLRFHERNNSWTEYTSATEFDGVFKNMPKAKSLVQAADDALNTLENTFDNIQVQLSKQLNVLLDDRNENSFGAPCRKLIHEKANKGENDNTNTSLLKSTQIVSRNIPADANNWWNVTAFQSDSENTDFFVISFLNSEKQKLQKSKIPISFLNENAISIEDLKDFKGDLMVLWTKLEKEKSNDSDNDLFASSITVLSLQNKDIFFSDPNSVEFSRLIVGNCKLQEYQDKSQAQHISLSVSNGRDMACTVNKVGSKITIIDLSGYGDDGDDEDDDDDDNDDNDIDDD